MKCKNVQDLFPLYEEKKLNRKTLEEIETHLQSCSRCMDSFSDFQKTVQLIENRQSPELPDGYLEKLERKIDEAHEEKLYMPWLLSPVFYVPSLAFLFIAAAITFYISFLDFRGITSPVPAERYAAAGKTPGQAAEKGASPSTNAPETKVIVLAKLDASNKEEFILRGGASEPRNRPIAVQWNGFTNKKINLQKQVTTAAEWDSLWAETGNDKTVPAVDFVKYKAVAIFTGRDANSLKSTHITRISETGSKIYVEIKESIAGNNNSPASYSIAVIGR